MAIKILVTGGTIDNLDYDNLDKSSKSYKTYVPALLKQARVTEDYNVKLLMFKDSKFITDQDRKIMLYEIKKCKEDNIIITHGTMTMPQTARFLGKSKIKKTIVLTGSAIPANKGNSDALFNLGFAFSSVQNLKNGVYVAMNGKIFSWNNVKKNLRTGFFEEEK